MKSTRPGSTRNLELNRKLWESWTEVNIHSDFYDVEGFKRGEARLDRVSAEGVGDVRGKSLLHLQCHFGLDTLDLARQGATVVGVDFSEAAVEFAQKLASEIGVDARFMCANLYEFSEQLHEQFDVVFTSHGVLGWLPDINGWAEIIAQHLKPGGFFFIAEMHPFAWIFDETRTDNILAIELPYFHQEQPQIFMEQGNYADPNADIEHEAHYWSHSVSDIIGALLKVGLILESFDEHPFLEWQHFPWMEQTDNGNWALPTDGPQIPLMFSLRARKPQT